VILKANKDLKKRIDVTFSPVNTEQKIYSTVQFVSKCKDEALVKRNFLDSSIYHALNARKCV